MHTILAVNAFSSTFILGRVVITANAMAELNPLDVSSSIRRHARGDWGDLCPEDIEQNRRALKEGGRLFSAYHDRRQTKFYIITEADHSITNVELHISPVMLSLQKC